MTTQTNWLDTPPPMARSSDPATSHAGARHAALRANSNAARLLEAFQKHFWPMTLNEAAAWCVKEYGGRAESYRKRVDRIRDQLKAFADRDCKITGCKATTYRASNAKS